MTRRFTVLACAAALSLGVFALPASASGGANPCKLLKGSEIVAALGGTVNSPQKGLTTPVSKSCDWKVAASADRPDGTLSVRVMTIGASAAYNGLKNQASLYVAVPQLGKALYSQKTGALSLLKGSTYLTVQGVFTAADPLPIHLVDVEPQLISLIKIARKRV
jgi:hypothetical protein